MSEFTLQTVVLLRQLFTNPALCHPEELLI
jgi:hypothetical protein